jgi:hypothetical protein
MLVAKELEIRLRERELARDLDRFIFFFVGVAAFLA